MRDGHLDPCNTRNAYFCSLIFHFLSILPWPTEDKWSNWHNQRINFLAINPLELAMEALKEIQSRFYRDFPAHPKEQVYEFATPSTLKPTQWFYPGGGINQIPGECTVSGDIRLTPFYSVSDAMKKLQEYVDDLIVEALFQNMFCQMRLKGKNQYKF